MAQGESGGLAQARAQGSDRTTGIPESDIRDELSRVLAGHEFRSSKRSQEFLRYVVENTLAGHAEILKERTIGIEVFGRPVSYDPSEDATVRVKAGEVRKRLGIYYAAEGARNPLRIELPAGTYIPDFRRADPHLALLSPAAPGQQAAAGQEAAAHGSIAVPGQVRVEPRWGAWLIGSVLVLAGVAGAAWWGNARRTTTALDEFWAPVLRGTTPVSLCASFVPVYNLERDPNATQPPRVEDFTLLTDQFVGGGDLIAVSRLSAMLTRLRRPYAVRIGNETSFHDLRTAPAILVGYSYTRWKDISKELRFFIDGARRPIGITDNGAPTMWSLPNLPPDRRTNEDYAIVSRVFHPDTHAMLVEVAGITQYGTDAGADLVTNAELMAEALRGAPAGWQKKNLQLVLHVKVYSGTPSSPKLVASYFW